MKQQNQIALFFISILHFFFTGNVLYANEITYQLEAKSESLINEEEHEVSVVFLEITEVTPEISGGHPNTILDHSAAALSKEEITVVSAENIKSKYLSERFYLDKLPLYLRYLTLKLHCWLPLLHYT